MHLGLLTYKVGVWPVKMMTRREMVGNEMKYIFAVLLCCDSISVSAGTIIVASGTFFGILGSGLQLALDF